MTLGKVIAELQQWWMAIEANGDNQIERWHVFCDNQSRAHTLCASSNAHAKHDHRNEEHAQAMKDCKVYVVVVPWPLDARSYR